MGEWEKAIIKTLVYYDELNYPLTPFEIWKNLISRSEKSAASGPSLAEIIAALENEKIKRVAEEFHGFYFLKGRKKLVKNRITRNKISVSKLKRIRRLVSLFRGVPFVRMVLVTGRVALKNAQRRSDWDVLVVIRAGKIWTGRTLVTLLVWLLKKKRSDKKTIDRMCLNYFLTDTHLAIQTKDLFSAGEYMAAIPVLGKETFKKFQSANQWIKDDKPNFLLAELDNLHLLPNNYLLNFIQQGGEKILNGNKIENLLRRWELKRIQDNPKTHQPGSLVYADDQALIFLPDPQGPKIFEKFKKKINALEIG